MDRIVTWFHHQLRLQFLNKSAVHAMIMLEASKQATLNKCSLVPRLIPLSMKDPGYKATTKLMQI